MMSVKLPERLVGGAANVEQLVQPRDLEDLEDLRVNVGQDELPAALGPLLADGDQNAQRRAGQVLDFAEVEQEPRGCLGSDEVGQPLLDLVDRQLLEDLAVLALDDA